jgi:transcriptional regulator with XRE-family HTH domain
MEKTVGMRIQRLREKRGWSQIDLANKVGINNSVMSRIESGKRKIRADELQKIAAVLEVTPDQLLGDVSSKNRTISENKKRRIMELYDQLPEDQQRILDQMAEIMLREKNKKGDEYK